MGLGQIIREFKHKSKEKCLEQFKDPELPLLYDTFCQKICVDEMTVDYQDSKSSNDSKEG